jgi:arylsulfatase
LIRKDYKYFYWPEASYEQLFHIATDPYEESDIYNQTNLHTLSWIKARYNYLKLQSEAGNKV